MPLARMAMHNSGEQIHVAVWPTVHELHQLASRHPSSKADVPLAVGLMRRPLDWASHSRTGVRRSNRSRCLGRRDVWVEEMFRSAETGREITERAVVVVAERSRMGF